MSTQSSESVSQEEEEEDEEEQTDSSCDSSENSSEESSCEEMEDGSDEVIPENAELMESTMAFIRNEQERIRQRVQEEVNTECTTRPRKKTKLEAIYAQTGQPLPNGHLFQLPDRLCQQIPTSFPPLNQHVHGKGPERKDCRPTKCTKTKGQTSQTANEERSSQKTTNAQTAKETPNAGPSNNATGHPSQNGSNWSGSEPFPLGTPGVHVRGSNNNIYIGSITNHFPCWDPSKRQESSKNDRRHSS